MKGIKNPRRDPTGGSKTILHELGHTLGLTHSATAGAVMQASLARAGARLTDDDVKGVRAIWQRLRSNPADSSAQVPSGKEKAEVKVRMRYASWFKTSTRQSYSLSDKEKCPLEAGQELLLQLPDGRLLHEAHVKVLLAEDLPRCAAGAKGTSGYLYQPHMD
jgi:hypothetical protein